MRTTIQMLTVILSLLICSAAMANSVGSSTMEFEGTLTDNGDGTYSGVIPMIVGGGYDIYGEEGGTAWFGNDPGTGPVWTSQAIGADHDAWPTWTPDTPDWYQYSLKLYVDASTNKWAVRNHAGATEANPWYDEGFWGAGGVTAKGVPMSGLMDYAYLYAVEKDVGAYLSGTGTPEIPGGAAGYGGGPGAWDMDWSWGSEVVPLEYAGFDVDIQDLGSGIYHVTLTPAALTEVWVDDDFTSATPGWGVTHFASIQDGIDAVSGSTVNVAAGTYAEQLVIDKALSLVGAGATATLLEPGAYPVINVTANDVTLSDLGVSDPVELAEGIQVNSTANLTLTRVDFPNLGAGAGVNAYGVNLKAGFIGLTVTDCDFGASVGSFGVYTRSIGIFAPNSLTLGDFSISGCTFDEIWTSIYLRSGIDGLDVTGCAFGWVDPADYAACVAGIYLGDGDDDGFDLLNVNVTGNEFTDYGRGVYVWNYGANATIDNFVISGNTFTDSGWSAGIRFIIGLNGVENYSIDGIDINNNTFVQNSDVGGYVGMIDLRTYDATLLTCDISVTDNELTFTGAPYTDAMFGIGFTVGGDGFYNTTVARNVIDGGGTGGAGTMAAAGMKISHDADDYTWTHALDLDIVNNVISGFDHGLSVYDNIDASYGGLPTGTDVAINGNSIVGDVYGVVNDDGVAVDASGNWWGTADATAVSGEFSGPVDYTPWLGIDSDTSGDPGYQGDYSVLGVDDDGAQTGTTGRISEAIGLVSGSTINVAAGTYAERLNISKSLDLIGPQDGVDPTVTGARTNPANEAVIDITGIGVMNPNVAVEIPSGVTDVTVSGFTVLGSPTSYYADESVVRIWDDEIVISDNILEGYTGILYKGADGLDVRRNRITVNKDGVVCQPNVATDVEISGNSIALGSSPAGGESAMYATSVTGLLVSDNTATGFVNGRGIGGSNLTDVDIIGNRFTGNNDAVSLWGTTTFVDILNNNLSGNARHGINIKGQDITITGNQINGNGDTGVNIDYNVLDTERVVVNSNSLVLNTNYGIQVDTANITETVDGESNWWGSATGPTHAGNPGGTGDASTDGVDYDPWIGKTGSENIVCDPDPLDLNIATSSGSIDVNYLGGGGGMVFGYSVTVTWNPAVATLTGITEGSLLSDAGNTNFFYYGTGGTRTIDCTLTPPAVGVTGPGTLFTLDFDAAGSGVSTVDLGLVAFRDNANQPLSGFYEDDGVINADITAPVFTDVSLFNLTLAHTDAYAKDGDNLKLTADVTDDHTTLLTTDIEADLSTLLAGGGSSVNPDTYDGAVATWTIPLAGVTLTADGGKTVTVTATDWLGNSASDSDDIEVDNTAPGTITGLDASPAHEEVVLTWDDASGLDTNYRGVMLRYNVWGDYPTYDLATPVYPGSYTAGTLALADDYSSGVTHSIVPRDIHYYSAFVYDQALNYGGVTTAGQDRATNYWLGDVAVDLGDWGYNGLVNVADIDKLGGQYGQAPTGFYLECDVGPTDDNSRVGIPEPDDMVSFEDLMIFAMNYGVVAPRIVPFLAEPGIGDLALAVSERGRMGDVLTLAVRVEGNFGEVKGLSTELEFEGLEFLSAGLSAEMSAPVAEVFFWSDATSSSAQVDLAVLGTDVTIGGSGDVAVLTFRIVDDAYEVDFASATLRGAENDELTAELKGLTVDEIPASFKLIQNTPNPFNPVTTVGYNLPSESRVTIRVFDVTGRLVTTLVDGVVEPGRHSVAWNGTNEYGESVGSGVYFCTMETPEYRGSHKMTLLK